jgi:hypothetical protein
VAAANLADAMYTRVSRKYAGELWRDVSDRIVISSCEERLLRLACMREKIGQVLVSRDTLDPTSFQGNWKL